VRGGACRQTDSAVVDEDDFAFGGNVVDEGRIPVIKVSPGVLEEDQGNRASPAEMAVCVTRSVGDVMERLGAVYWDMISLSLSSGPAVTRASVPAAFFSRCKGHRSMPLES
jgi:hypothetical protein